MRKTILITGATDGIGRQTALELARKGARVIVHGRDPGRAEKTSFWLGKETGNDPAEWIADDLSLMANVRAMAAEVLRRVERLDVLLNNAGVYMHERVVTADGMEATFAVNHAAPFLLTHLLLDLLKTSAPSRIVTVSSVAHTRAAVDFDNLQGEKRFEPYGAYALSKLGNVLFTYELAERLKDTGVTANCLHPGVISTKLLRIGFGSTGASLEEGAATSVYVATAPELEGVSGKYFVRSAEAETSKTSHDRELRKKFWEVTDKLVRTVDSDA